MSASFAILKCCSPKGMPMMVIHQSAPARHQLSPLTHPPKRNHKRLPRHPMGTSLPERSQNILRPFFQNQPGLFPILFFHKELPDLMRVTEGEEESTQDNTQVHGGVIMGDYKSPFTITNEILSYVSSVSEKMGRITAISSLESKPHLRRNNHIRSIHVSAEIIYSRQEKGTSSA